MGILNESFWCVDGEVVPRAADWSLREVLWSFGEIHAVDLHMQILS